jgi:hypothetical protein
MGWTSVDPGTVLSEPPKVDGNRHMLSFTCPCCAQAQQFTVTVMNTVVLYYAECQNSPACGFEYFYFMYDSDALKVERAMRHEVPPNL